MGIRGFLFKGDIDKWYVRIKHSNITLELHPQQVHRAEALLELKQHIYGKEMCYGNKKYFQITELKHFTETIDGFEEFYDEI